MKPELIDAIMVALSHGQRVELLLDKEGEVIAQTVQRKRLKPDKQWNTNPRPK